MPGCVGNYSIPTSNGNVEGVDTLAGAGILNFQNIYVQQTPLMLLIVLLIILGFGVDFSQLYINDVSKLSICRPNLYWPVLLVSCTVASWRRPTSKLP